jgi:hypothetical protein
MARRFKARVLCQLALTGATNGWRMNEWMPPAEVWCS